MTSCSMRVTPSRLPTCRTATATGCSLARSFSTAVPTGIPTRTVVRWVTATHTMRYHAHYGSSGQGHVYQGRFKSFPIQGDGHFLVACRYVERNALRAGLVDRAEDWRWGSLWRRVQQTAPEPKLLSACPVRHPENWVAHVNKPLTEKEIQAVRCCANRGRPLGDAAWIKLTVRKLGLESTLRSPGRPRGKKGSGLV